MNTKKVSIITAVITILFGVILGLAKAEDKRYSYKS